MSPFGTFATKASRARATLEPHRLCPVCSAVEAIRLGEPIWPVNRHCPSCRHVPPSDGPIPLLAPELVESDEGFDRAAFEPLEAIEGGHFWFVPRNRLLVTLMQRHFPAATRILEIGCGTGFVLREIAQRFPTAQIVGAELHPSGLAVAHRRLNSRAEFVQMDARHIPAAAVFDVIGAFDVLEHIDDDDQVIRSMWRALRPGAGVVISVPQHPWLWSAADQVARHVRRYHRGELERKLTGAGFDIALSTSYCFLTLPLMAASRVVQRLMQGRSRSGGTMDIEVRPNAIANTALKAILDLEVTATLAGLRFPVGGSRVVVALRPISSC
jgi:SAM-dependent methyltransferase